MVLVIIPQSGRKPTQVAFASLDNFNEFVCFFRGEYAVQHIEDGGLFLDKLKGRLDAMTEDEANHFYERYLVDEEPLKHDY